ncbi:hypothetical protein [Nonomuraea pusilla]|uniref:ABC-2 type transport system ATP-binding protein n=1 Tax=Nonomuraea pusilla TaxID=46177 RepID=A0A1H7YGM6_9ACTN|nr:hypothetical protein [Nonomuraea pusilla]SEM45416.1 ABC-2 type transport system ATP-binding protein [Nonomuraea pusilla]
MEEAEQYGDRVALMRRGRARAAGTPGQLTGELRARRGDDSAAVQPALWLLGRDLHPHPGRSDERGADDAALLGAAAAGIAAASRLVRRLAR